MREPAGEGAAAGANVRCGSPNGPRFSTTDNSAASLQRLSPRRVKKLDPNGSAEEGPELNLAKAAQALRVGCPQMQRPRMRRAARPGVALLALLPAVAWRLVRP